MKVGDLVSLGDHLEFTVALVLSRDGTDDAGREVWWLVLENGKIEPYPEWGLTTIVVETNNVHKKSQSIIIL